MEDKLPFAPEEIQALTFDIFGTVFDWRTSILREGAALAQEKGLLVDWGAFADAWRAEYKPSMERVRSGALPWKKLDELHRMSLNKLLPAFGIEGLTETEKDRLNRVWHRLTPWPDALPGLRRLHGKFVLATLSNGNLSLLGELVAQTALPFDSILSAELARHYKPDPEVYITAVEMLNLAPYQILMVAAHQEDLRAAASVGLRTAMVLRPYEYGVGKIVDLTPDPAFDLVANDIGDLAAQLGA